MIKALQKTNSILQNHSILLIEGGIEIGKSTFVKTHYPEYEYVSMKTKNHKSLLQNDPYRFFNSYLNKTIFDDIEEVPGFIELICTYSLSIYQTGNYILISNIFQEYENILVKRCSYFPMDISELKIMKRFKLTLEGNCLESGFPALKSYTAYLKTIFSNYFPKIVRVQNQDLLLSLLKECIIYIDKPINLNAIAKKLKISQPTVQMWLETFEKTGLIHFLKPLEISFNKRIIKSPKLYFSDCGVVAHLLKITQNEQLLKSDYFLPLYSNLIFLEFYKKNCMESKPKNMFYWRESNGHEIKFVFENPTSYDIYEVITSHEILKKHHKELDFFDEISEGKVLSKNIVYGGYKNYLKNDTNIISWQLV